MCLICGDNKCECKSKLVEMGLTRLSDSEIGRLNDEMKKCDIYAYLNKSHKIQTEILMRILDKVDEGGKL